MQPVKFGYEELEVWQRSLDLSKTIFDLTEQLADNRKHFRLISQIEAASASISANIAEGKGRYSKREFLQFLYIARGSLFETVTYLEIFFKNQLFSENQYNCIKLEASEISKMLSGLITSIKRSLP